MHGGFLSIPVLYVSKFLEMELDKYSMELFRVGDSEIFKKVFESHYHRIYFLAKNIVNDNEYAEDIVAMAFIRLWEAKDRIHGRDHLLGFLFRTARNLSIDAMRRMERHRMVSVESMQLEGIDIVDEDTLQKNMVVEICSHIFSKIDEMPERCRKVMILRYKDGYSIEEIAEEMGISYNTVRSFIWKGIKLLEKQIDQIS